MAGSNVNSPTKAQIYESLYVISLATQQIAYHLERLRSANVLSERIVGRGKTAANELRAQIAASSTINLTSQESEDAFRQQKRRLQMDGEAVATSKERKKPTRK